VPRVPSVWVQLSAKWAGSGKISGCGDRTIYCSTLSDDNNDKTRAASKYLKVLLRSNNYNRSKVYYQKWNYWKFEFSPHKNKAERIIADIDCVGYYSQVRSQTHLTKTIKSISGGTKYILKQGNNDNWYSTFFRSRGIVAKKLGYIRLKAKQNKFQHQGIIGDGSKAYCVINYIICWLKYRRMDILRTTEKRKRSNDILQDEVLGEEMDLSTDSDTSLQQQVSIGLLQEDKYWVTICELIDNLITVLQKMTSTDILTLQIMQLQSNMRSDQRDEEGKIRRYRILREEASRLAAAVNPPVTLENLIRHDL